MCFKVPFKNKTDGKVRVINLSIEKPKSKINTMNKGSQVLGTHDADII